MQIVTCGDSWSKGEWIGDNKGHRVIHGGINTYFKEDGHQVYNIHRFSNRDSITALEDYLKENSPDVIFYFFTDPFRDLTDPEIFYRFVNFEHLATDIMSFQQLHQTLIHKSLKKLDKLGRKIYVLGGCQRLEDKKYKNIKILIESIAELVCPEYKHPLYWDSGWSSFLKFESVKFDRKFFDLIEHHHKLQWAMETDKFAKMFRPDGFHPNRKAHFKLYQYLKENVNELK
jgi:hypothetical protein